MQIRYCSTSLILVNFWNIVFGTVPNCIQVESFLLQLVVGSFHIFTITCIMLVTMDSAWKMISARITVWDLTSSCSYWKQDIQERKWNHRRLYDVTEVAYWNGWNRGKWTRTPIQYLLMFLPIMRMIKPLLQIPQMPKKTWIQQFRTWLS